MASPTTPPRRIRSPYNYASHSQSSLSLCSKNKISPRSIPLPISPPLPLRPSPTPRHIQRPTQYNSPYRSRPCLLASSSTLRLEPPTAAEFASAPQAKSSSSHSPTSTGRSCSSSTSHPRSAPPQGTPATSVSTSPSSFKATGLLASFLPFASASCEDVSTLNMATTERQPHIWGKPLAKLRAKASSPSLRAPGGTERSPRTSEETLTDSPDALDAPQHASLRHRAKLWAKNQPVPPFLHIKGRDNSHEAKLPDAFALVEEESPIDIDEDVMSRVSRYASICQTPTIRPNQPAVFELKPLSHVNGTKQAPTKDGRTVPYPLCYDSVLQHTFFDTHQLVKALTPTKNNLTFTEFAKPPSTVLDLACGEGYWILEAAQQWKYTRFVGLDLVDIQPDLDNAGYEDIRGRVSWVHSNFLTHALPFPNGEFEFIRMSHIAMAVPEDKWKKLLFEIRRVLKPNGVLEWIDEQPQFHVSPHYSSSDPQVAANSRSLELDFHDMLADRGLTKALPTVTRLLKNRAMTMKNTTLQNMPIGLPGPDTQIAFNVHDVKPSSAVSSSSSSSSTLRKSSESRRSEEHDHCCAAPRKSSDKDLPALPRSAPPFMPRGVILMRDKKFLPLPPDDVKALATRNMQMVLASAEALYKYRQEIGVPENRQEFDEKIWEYERSRYARMHFPKPISGWESDDDEDDATFPSLFSTNFRRRSPNTAQLVGNYGEPPTEIRRIFVLTAHSG